LSRNNEKWTRYLFIQVVKGLEKIHDSGIAHLDIKIDNIFVNIPADGTGGIQLKIGNFRFS
jgi:serine/threonine protein kinase